MRLGRPKTITEEQWKIVDDFHVIFYNRSARWMNHPIIKNPMDLIIYQEIIGDTRPDTIIECGTGGGGSSLFLACMMAMNNLPGRVLTIDQNEDLEAFYKWAFPWMPPEHPFPMVRPNAPNLTYLNGNSVSPSMMRKIRSLVDGRVMVILDSSHREDHVFDECEFYGSLVTPGCYLVVEDINICGHPIETPDWGDGGPYAAVETFLKDHTEFMWDERWVGQYLLTYNAYLRRKTADDAIGEPRS